jgi:hypothetical protein
MLANIHCIIIYIPKEYESSKVKNNLILWDREPRKKKKPVKECPLYGDELGRNTWSFLHTTAAYYPDNPTPTQQTDTSFIYLPYLSNVKQTYCLI